MDRRRYGFPLHMLLGFSVGAGIAVALAFGFAPEGRVILYTALVKLLFALGGAGAYLGHVVGAVRNRDAGLKPFGEVPPGALALGAGMVLLGSVAVAGAVLGVMTAMHGPPPH